MINCISPSASYAFLTSYDRCGNPQKSIDLFDAVMSSKDDEINNDKNRYSNKDKNEIQRLSKTFVNYNLQPNIRTYNTVLKALRGYKSFEKCLGVVRSMRNNGIQPDSVTVNTLVDAAVITGNLEIAEDVSVQSIAISKGHLLLTIYRMVQVGYQNVYM